MPSEEGIGFFPKSELPSPESIIPTVLIRYDRRCPASSCHSSSLIPTDIIITTRFLESQIWVQ